MCSLPAFTGPGSASAMLTAAARGSRGILQSTSQRRFSTMSGGEGKKILIVGGVAGGATAAARLRRLDERANITVFERGPDVSYA